MKQFKLILLLLSVWLSTNSQVLKYEFLNSNHIRKTLRIHTDSCIIDLEVLEEYKDMKTKPELYYHWYKNRKIFINQGGIGGNVLDGSYNCYSRSDKLLEKGEYKKGLKHKTWKKWDTSGELVHQENYKNGLLHGKCYYYSDSLSVLNFKKGEIVTKRKLFFAGKTPADSVYLLPEEEFAPVPEPIEAEIETSTESEKPVENTEEKFEEEPVRRRKRTNKE